MNVLSGGTLNCIDCFLIFWLVSLLYMSRAIRNNRVVRYSVFKWTGSRYLPVAIARFSLLYLYIPCVDCPLSIDLAKSLVLLFYQTVSWAVMYDDILLLCCNCFHIAREVSCVHPSPFCSSSYCNYRTVFEWKNWYNILVISIATWESDPSKLLSNLSI